MACTVSARQDEFQGAPGTSVVEADFYHAGSLLPLTDEQVSLLLPRLRTGWPSIAPVHPPSQTIRRLTALCQACTLVRPCCTPAACSSSSSCQGRVLRSPGCGAVSGGGEGTVAVPGRCGARVSAGPCAGSECAEVRLLAHRQDVCHCSRVLRPSVCLLAPYALRLSALPCLQASTL